MPAARERLSLGGISGVVYALGGRSTPHGCSAVGLAEAYHVASGTWSSIQGLPTPRWDMGSAVVNGVLYTVGGATGCSAPTGALESYDPATGQWTIHASMPHARESHGVGAVSGRIYAIGGVYDQAGVDVYDVASGSWSSGAPMPTARSNFGLGVVGGKLYAVGGADPNPCCLTTVEAYDPVTNSWTTMAPMPTGRYDVRVVVVNDILYAIGGMGAGGMRLSTVEAYDPVTNTWTAQASMPTARRLFGAAAEGGVIYAIGGEDNGEVLLSVNEIFTPEPAGPLDQSITFAPLPGARFGDSPFQVQATASSGLSVTFSVAGSCSISGDVVSLTGAGSCAVTADQAGNAGYNPAPSVTQSFAIARAKPVINWAAPSPMTSDELLGSTQLNATAIGVDSQPLAGVFVYDPPAGTQLAPGNRLLTAEFTPRDQINYRTATERVHVRVIR